MPEYQEAVEERSRQRHTFSLFQTIFSDLFFIFSVRLVRRKELVEGWAADHILRRVNKCYGAGLEDCKLFGYLGVQVENKIALFNWVLIFIEVRYVRL